MPGNRWSNAEFEAEPGEYRISSRDLSARAVALAVPTFGRTSTGTPKRLSVAWAIDSPLKRRPRPWGFVVGVEAGAVGAWTLGKLKQLRAYTARSAVLFVSQHWQ